MEERARILVCDDSPAYRRVIQAMLAPGYEVALCESGEEALARALEFHPDLILSDVIMGGMNGYELVRRVRADPAFAHVPVVLLTSKTDDEARATGLEAGADDYLFKPIRARELGARVASLLRLRRAMLALYRTEKLSSLGQLVAGIAHELNNPLNYVQGNVAFLSEYARTLNGLVEAVDALPGLPDDARAAFAARKQEVDYDYLRADLDKLLDGVREGTTRATEIVRGLRAFGRVGGGNGEVETDLGKLVEQALTILHHEMRDRIRVERALDAVPPVSGDPSRIAQVLINVLLNAIQAIPGQGHIRVELRAAGDCVRCAIRDTGTGIDPGVRPRIFDPFFTTRPDATGLGLAVAYGIVREHGGDIDVASAPGQGSTFTISLPVHGRKATM